MIAQTLAVLLLLGAAPSTEPPAAPPERVLRVCADPNNLPFSNQRQEGLENRLAELLARELKATVQYTWWAQRRGFIRNTLKAGLCDVVLGVPADFELALTTRPYYRSTYVFVYRKDRGLKLGSLEDEALRTLKVGVHLIGDDMANTPPAHALARRGIVNNVVGYTLYGDYTQENPPSALIEAVRRGEVDVAIAWGPLAGYFALRPGPELEVVPVQPRKDTATGLPFVFDISVGVRRGDKALKAELEAALSRRRPEVEALLTEYGVPRP
ncbi:substrate-binding domain-containing protein [Hyalangium rubrum]|uniref:Substrate-binding domain-containing protein n=1 Tax=Hyalangium rubrum TaxID=3103134 RepID=A0ABU5H2U6_9BACT|nr:substrate-binding domain-containing protein [Hyalangium sp. s54d21]MDY7227700.1 substrate-binding domain-containing protein [Hyalangium sp. s54d21]